MIKIIKQLLRHATYNLRGGFLVRPLIIAVVMGCGGMLLSQLEAAYPALSGWAPSCFFPSHADPGIAQVILSDIATSVMTVVSIVFAILLMTLTLASMQFSPRILAAFAQDRTTQWTLGIFLGTFSYCIAALPVARTRPTPDAPVVTVLGAMLLAFLCVAWLLYFIHHISRAISVNYIVDRLAAETELVIDKSMPDPVDLGHLESADTKPPTGAFPVASTASGYVRYVDVERLVKLATAHDLGIWVTRRVGRFVAEGAELVVTQGQEPLTTEVAAEIRGAFDIGPTRTLEQDVEFGILQIVDIALKAISPAVNDPSTAICCVDHLGRLMIRIAQREPPPAAYFSPSGSLRLAITWVTFEQFLDSAFEQIRAYSMSDLAVCLRMMRTFLDMGALLPDQERRLAVLERGRRVVAGAAENLKDAEMRELRDRLDSLERLSGCGG